MYAGNLAPVALYMVSLPLDANVLFLTDIANEIPFVGQGSGGQA